jgi:ribonuclease E
MLFSNLLVAIALTVLFPLGLMGMLAAGEWLERRTLAAEEVVPRRLRRMESKPPEAVEAMVLEETAHVVAQYWSATGRPASQAPAPETPAPQTPAPEAPAPLAAPEGHTNGDDPAAVSRNGSGGRHARRVVPSRAGRHERRR